MFGVKFDCLRSVDLASQHLNIAIEDKVFQQGAKACKSRVRRDRHPSVRYNPVPSMKLQDPNWRFESPAVFPTDARTHFRDLIQKIAAQGPVQDLLETFKYRFSGGSSSRSSSADYALYDLSSYLEKAAENAPLFVDAFVSACADIGADGHATPSIALINKLLKQFDVGFEIEGDTVIHTLSACLPDVRSSEHVRPDAAPKTTIRAATGKGGFQSLLQKSVAPKAAAPLLKAFLCHSSGDKPRVRKLHDLLKADGYAPWLDAINLLPGQDWEAEIKKAVRGSHVVIVCLSNGSTTKAGFVQKEIRQALDVADEQPEGRIFIIPARLEDCDVPDRLSRWHWVDLFQEDGYTQLCASLNVRTLEL